MKQIDNRKVSPPTMKYQYFDICQLAEYPQVTLEVKDSKVFVLFDGQQIDTFDIIETINLIVKENLKPLGKEEKQKC